MKFQSTLFAIVVGLILSVQAQAQTPPEAKTLQVQITDSASNKNFYQQILSNTPPIPQRTTNEAFPVVNEKRVQLVNNRFSISCLELKTNQKDPNPEYQCVISATELPYVDDLQVVSNATMAGIYIISSDAYILYQALQVQPFMDRHEYVKSLTLQVTATSPLKITCYVDAKRENPRCTLVRVL